MQRALSQLPLMLHWNPADTAVFNVGYDDAGALAPVRWSHPRTSPEDDAQIQRVIAQHVPPRSEPRRFITGIVVKQDSLRLLPWLGSYSCPPFLLNRSAIAQEIQRVGRAHGVQGRGAVVQILVGNNGAPLDVKLFRSTGVLGADRDIVRVFGAARFLPGRMENFPIPTWAEIPLEFGGR